MKNKISILLVLLMSLSCFTFTAISAGADFGMGAQIVAADINMIKTGLTGQKISFTDGDFKSALAIGDFKSITITKIPSSTEGTLLLGGRRVGDGRVIKRKNLSSLTFIPASDSVRECSFKFTVNDYADGAEFDCIIKFIDRVNYAPKVNVDTVGVSAVTTQKAISTYGNLSATDPEGDEIEFIIVSYPKKGAISLLDSKSGEYCYTPSDKAIGKDKFTFVVRDEYGNYSEPTTVSVKITERMCDTVYRDMTDRKEYNAAVAMTAMGIMSGKQIGEDFYFEPNETVTRAEAVALAMKCAGIRADTTLSSTYFDDDCDISSSLKGYIATAQRTGLIVGDFKNGKLLFSPNEKITKYEMAKILSDIFKINNQGEESVFATDNNIPVWARAGVYSMCSIGIFDSEDTSSLSNGVTRADLAEYLYRILHRR